MTPDIESLSRSQRLFLIFAGAGLSVLAIGALDVFTGADLSLQVLYLGPCAILTWRLGRGPGLLMAAASAAVWLAADTIDGHSYSHPVFAASNSLTLLSFLVASVAMLSTIRDVLFRERQHARIDHLTGLWNARALCELGEREFTLAQRELTVLSVAYLDLDDFKKVNDTVGHLKADELLRLVATTLRGVLRQSDIVGRLGGDEFAVVMPRTPTLNAEPILKRALEVVTASTRDAGFTVSFSLGFVSTSTGTGSFESLLSGADRRMYKAKRAGKSGIFGPPANNVDPTRIST